MENSNEKKLHRAKKRVEELKGLFIHSTVYIVINSFILVNIYLRSNNEGEIFWKWKHFFVLFFWGIGLGFHAVNALNYNPFFSKKWEERQIQKYMEKDRQEADKFK